MAGLRAGFAVGCIVAKLAAPDHRGCAGLQGWYGQAEADQLSKSHDQQ